MREKIFKFLTPALGILFSVFLLDLTFVSPANALDVYQPPIAAAGPDQTVNEGDFFRIDCTNSYDPDGAVYENRIYSCEWKQVAGPPLDCYDWNATMPNFYAPEVGSAGESLVFELTVTDYHGLKATDTVIVNVLDTSVSYEPPIAAAGPDQTVNERDLFRIDCTKSYDPDGAVYNYRIYSCEWKQIAGPPLDCYDWNAAAPYFYAPEVGPAGESLIFELTVTDYHGLKATDTVIVNVTWHNNPPVARTRNARLFVTEGDVVILDGSPSSDPDDGIFSYGWKQTLGTPVTLSAPGSPKTSFVAPKVRKGKTNLLEFDLIVIDNHGLQSTTPVLVEVARRKGRKS